MNSRMLTKKEISFDYNSVRYILIWNFKKNLLTLILNQL